MLAAPHIPTKALQRQDTMGIITTSITRGPTQVTSSGRNKAILTPCTRSRSTRQQARLARDILRRATAQTTRVTSNWTHGCGRLQTTGEWYERLETPHLPWRKVVCQNVFEPFFPLSFRRLICLFYNDAALLVLSFVPIVFPGSRFCNTPLPIFIFEVYT